jgi:hypothetical protein
MGYQMAVFNGTVCALAKARYGNGALAVLAFCDGDYGCEQYATITVNLDATMLGNTTYLNHDIQDAGMILQDAGYGWLTGRTAPSGYVDFQEFAWDDGVIEDMPEAEDCDFDAMLEAIRSF